MLHLLLKAPFPSKKIIFSDEGHQYMKRSYGPNYQSAINIMDSLLSEYGVIFTFDKNVDRVDIVKFSWLVVWLVGWF